MEFKVKISDIQELETPLVVIAFSEEQIEQFKKEIYGELGALLSPIIKKGDFTGKKDQLSLIYTEDKIQAERVLLVGLGKTEKIDIELIRSVLGVAARKIIDRGIKKIAVDLSFFVFDKLKKVELSEAIVQGLILGSYQNKHYQTKDLDKFKELEECTIFAHELEKKSIKQAVDEGKIIAESVNFCRQLAWRPANYITPTKLAEEAKRLETEYKINTTVFSRDEAKEIGLTSFLAVAQGTEEPPKFIIMEYGADKKNVDTLAFVGKAITFDTGGISIKPSKGMVAMKADMTGGAVVIAIMEAIARLDLDLHIVGIVPATDNMPSGKAYHPGDVILSYSGQTIEVISTDAEGRMVLNDGLTYAAKNYNPTAMFDVATLTGSIMVALGSHAIGYFANDEKVADALEEASKTSGERVWRMPLWEVYDKQLKSDVADMKHTGGRPAGAVTAARFLSKFVMDTPWAHLDIAGVMGQESTEGYNPKGSKGPAVRLLLDVLRNWK